MEANFRYTKPELAAKKVLAECGLNDPTELPISEIILGRKAFYEEMPMKGKDGEIVSVDGRSIITINSNIAFETRKRFAAAHELGHYEMHRNIQAIFSDTEADLLNWYQGGPHEMEANQFAAEFLMPSDFFYNECKRKVFGPDVIEYLSNKFIVSKTAAILKFVERGNHPISVVFSVNNQMKWFKSSKDVRNYLLFEKDAPPPTGTVAYEVFKSGVGYRKEELKQDIWKSDWFRINDDATDTRFYEYCLYVKSYNYTLSVIWEK